MERDEIFDVIYGDHEDFEDVTDEKLEEQSRWSVYKSKVVKQKSTGKLFGACWGEGATEYQEDQEEYCGLTEVEPKEVTIIKYYSVQGGNKYEV